jgi:hypothetical protein
MHDVDKLTIKNEMREFDLKNRSFYDELTDEERKKFSNFLMLRWGSAVRGSADLQEFYVISTNERMNKHFFTVNRHPKLQWLMSTSVSPDMGVQEHHWVAPKKKDTVANSNDIKKTLMEMYPAMKIGDIEVLSKMVTKNELRDYVRDHGTQD